MVLNCSGFKMLPSFSHSNISDPSFPCCSLLKNNRLWSRKLRHNCPKLCCKFCVLETRKTTKQLEDVAINYYHPCAIPSCM